MMIWHEKFHMCKLRHLCLFSDAKKALDKDKSGNVSVAERVVKESWYGFETRWPYDQSKQPTGWNTHLDKSKRNEGKQTKPKVKGALSNKFQGQALGLGRILCLTCFFFLENDCSEKSLVDPVDWTSSSLQFLHVSIFIRCRKNVGPGFSIIFDRFLSMIGFSSGYISSDTFLFSVLNLMSEFTP